MLKRIQIWLYQKLLEYRFKKDGKWQISEDFVLAVCNRFKDEWLKDVDVLKLMDNEVIIYYKTIDDLFETIEDVIRFIEAEQTIAVSGYRYNSFAERKSLNNYLVDKNKKPIDPESFQKELKNKTNRLATIVLKNKEGSEIQYGYYRRNCDKLFSDILDIYSTLLLLAK